MANSVDPDQTAPIGAVCSGSTLLASSNIKQLFAADDFSRQHFQMHFFLGALRVNYDMDKPNSKGFFEWSNFVLILNMYF